jgi:hypothetical protein
MATSKKLIFAAPILVFLVPVLRAQQPSARDAFWSASDLISVAPNPAAHKHPAAHAHAAPRATPTSDATSASGEPSPAGVVKAVQLVSDNGYGAAPHLVLAAAHRLGLRCSLLLRDVDGAYDEVPPGSVFHSGDHIRLSLLANEPGYLYVIEQGSTGAWAPIFPGPKSAPGANRIAAGQAQMVPGGTQAFAFDQNPGDENLFVILSRTPIADIDRVIDNMKGNHAAPAPAEAPAVNAPTTLIAENHIPDLFVQQLASRDLTLVDEQKVDDSSQGPAGGEKAIYVVSKEGSSVGTSRVVLSLDLRHE